MPSRQIRLLGAVVGLGACLGCGAGSSAFRAGRRAELRKDYDTALVHYEKAVQAQPDDARYILHEKLARTQASLFHLKQGRRLLTEGRSEEAVGEFQKAAATDPTNEAAMQELTRLLGAQAAAKRAREQSIRDALQARDETATPTGARLKPFPPEPLAHFRISADSRKVYETLAKLADLNVAFTSDFRPSPISVDLSNVKLEEALMVVAHQTKTFWKTITPNTILVIPDNPNNRREYEEEVLRTFYLANPMQPADRTAITTALKQILNIQRILDNPDANAIIVRDTPAKVAAAEKMIRDLDRAKAEILIEVSVVEADRDRIRELGLNYLATPPLPPATILGLGYNPPTTTTGATIPTYPLNKLRLYSGDFSVVLPGAIANALLNDTHTRILQNPQVRVTDGQTAKLRIGNRVPFATGSFLPSFGGLTGGGTGGGAANFGLLASTQFQYQDVGVNLDLSPRLLANGEVALKAKIEISSIGSIFRIGGLDQPSFGQRIIEHDIRLKEGEVNLLGGLIESTSRRAVSGLPGLGDIPGLRYLFSSERSERVETEVLVMLTPRVIRLPEAAMGADKALALKLTSTGSEPTPPAAPPEITPEPPAAPPAEPPPQPPAQPE